MIKRYIFLFLIFIISVFPCMQPLHKNIAYADTQTTASQNVNNININQLMDMLNNPDKRQQFIETLKTLNNIENKTIEDNKTPWEKTFQKLSFFAIYMSHQSNILLEEITNFHDIIPWLKKLKTSPSLQLQIINICLRVALMIIGGLILSFTSYFLLRGPRIKMQLMAQNLHDKEVAEQKKIAEAAAKEAARKAKEELEEKEKEKKEKEALEKKKASADAATTDATDKPSIADPTQMDATQTHIDKTSANTAEETVNEEKVKSSIENERNKIEEDKQQINSQVRTWQGSMSQMIARMRRIPYVMGLFWIDIFNIMMFPVMALIIQSCDPAPTPQAVHAVWGTSWLASVAFGVWVAILRSLFNPIDPAMRLLSMRDKTSWFFFRSLKRIGLVSSWGVTGIIILKNCTVPNDVLHSTSELLAFIIHLMIAFMVIHLRGAVNHACSHIVERRPTLKTLMGIFTRTWWIAFLFFDFGLWLVWVMKIQGGYQLILNIFIRTVIALAALHLIRVFILTSFDHLLERIANSSINPNIQTRVANYAPITIKIINIFLGIVAILILAIAWGAPVHFIIGKNSFGYNIFSFILTIATAVGIGIAIWESVNIILENRITALQNQNSTKRSVKLRIARLHTLQPMVRILLLLILVIVIGLTILSEIGVNIGPLLAGASIFGVALGFGTQKLVQDFISGLFLLLENSLAVGDAVTLNGTYGIVERLSIRTVHVRGDDGSMNIFPFSSLTQTINYNRDFGRALIIVQVGYENDIGMVFKTLSDITTQIRKDPDYKDLVIDDFQLWGVDSLNDTCVVIKGAIPTIPTARKPIEREFKRRMLLVFDERKIYGPDYGSTITISNLDLISKQMEVENDLHKPQQLKVDPQEDNKSKPTITNKKE